MSITSRTLANTPLSPFDYAKFTSASGDIQAICLVDSTGAEVTVGSVADAATGTKQDTGNTSLASIDGKITACNTGAVTVSTSALPSGAATSAKQDTIIGHVDGIETSLGSIDGKITACNTGSIAGTVTCNAGTNLNTSALATESTLSTLNGKITACNTGAVVISSTPTEAVLIKTVDATASGDTTIHTPSTDTQIKLNYVCLSANGANSADVTVIVKLGGSNLYKVSLKPGAMWSRNLGSGRKYHAGSSNGALVVNLSAAQTVHVSMEYEQV